MSVMSDRYIILSKIELAESRVTVYKELLSILLERSVLTTLICLYPVYCLPALHIIQDTIY